MGMIGSWLGSPYFGCRLVVMSPLTFLARPERWLWAIHKHRGTLSASPNFGYEISCRRIDDKTIQGLDFSSWRLAFPPLNRGPIIDYIQRDHFFRTGQAIEAQVGEENLEFVACGQPLAGHQIRIVDPEGRELPERQQGRLEFKGPSVTSGY